LCRNCLQRQVIEGKIEEKIEVLGRQEKRSMQLLHDLKEVGILETERESTRSHSAENSLWKKLWTCHLILLISKNPPFRVL
jgi:transposase